MDVPIRCICPGSPHDGDTVTLRDKLDYRTVTTIRKSMVTIRHEDEAVMLAERLAACTEFYMLMGITGWTLVDEKGKPVPLSHAAIRERLFESDESIEVSNAAEEAYNPIVLLPLMEGASISSPPRSTDESTSPPLTPPKALMPSKRSSTSTTPTDGTETITSLPDGDSSTSPRAASAA